MFRTVLPLALLCALPLSAQIRVDLATPRLIDEFSDYQGVLDDYALQYRDEIAAIVSETLDKPLFMEGFGMAASAASAVPAALRPPASPFLSAGSSAAVYAEDLSGETPSTLSNLDPESDMKAGLCVLPLAVQGALPFTVMGQRGYAGLALGYIDADTGEYGVESLSAGLFAGITFLAPRTAPRIVSWEGVSLEAGGDWTNNRMNALFEPGRITQDIPLDPDGEGPLVPQDITLAVDPEVRAGIATELICLRASLRTGVTLFQALSLYGGGGILWSRTRTGITVESDAPIVIESYVSDLVDPEHPGSIAIDGTAAQFAAYALMPYLQGGLLFRVGPFGMGLPVVWKPGEALGTGFFVGVSL